ncbi:hypothetical protein KI387_043735 [Taxus chinensis]|uniref:Uncharacterized protein n=1 Tax=Taxus chinensis TaxID=29808 RepID=A0AA38LL90_TAXCH|nr:hypothetical protein KI387_043735 [Taxus chinensis]
MPSLTHPPKRLDLSKNKSTPPPRRQTQSVPLSQSKPSSSYLPSILGPHPSTLHQYIIPLAFSSKQPTPSTPIQKFQGIATPSLRVSCPPINPKQIPSSKDLFSVTPISPWLFSDTPSSTASSSHIASAPKKSRLVKTMYQHPSAKPPPMRTNHAQTLPKPTQLIPSSPSDFDPLKGSYAKILVMLVENATISLPPLRPYDPSKPRPMGYDESKICTYHRTLGHDVEGCKALKTILRQSPLPYRKIKKDNLRRERPLVSIPSPIPSVPASPRSVIITTPPLEDHELSQPSSSSQVYEINMISVATQGQKNNGKAKENTPAASLSPSNILIAPPPKVVIRGPAYPVSNGIAH